MSNPTRQLSYAVLHGPIHHPDTGSIGPVLQNWSDSARKGVKMSLDGEVVTVEVPVKRDAKRSKKFLIPLTGFTHTVLDETTSPKA